MEEEIIIKQIILVTHSQSNTGEDSIKAAAEAYKKGIIVNTVGIIDQKTASKNALGEIVHIARAGGGNYEYSYIEKLLQTMEDLIHKTVNRTLKNVINERLEKMIGEGINDMEPESRNKILNYIDKFSDDVGVRCCVLLDSSKGMINKFHTVGHGTLDLTHFLKGRKGRVDTAVLTFSEKDTYTCGALAIKEAIKLINEYDMAKFADSNFFNK